MRPATGWGTAPGRIVLDHGGRLVIEVQLTFVLDWRPPPSLELVFPEGERSEGTLLVTGTTRAASLQPGMLLRLVIQRPTDAPTPLALELVVDGRRLIIDPLG